MPRRCAAATRSWRKAFARWSTSTSRSITRQRAEPAFQSPTSNLQLPSHSQRPGSNSQFIGFGRRTTSESRRAADGWSEAGRRHVGAPGRQARSIAHDERADRASHLSGVRPRGRAGILELGRRRRRSAHRHDKGYDGCDGPGAIKLVAHRDPAKRDCTDRRHGVAPTSEARGFESLLLCGWLCPLDPFSGSSPRSAPWQARENDRALLMNSKDWLKSLGLRANPTSVLVVKGGMSAKLRLPSLLTVAVTPCRVSLTGNPINGVIAPPVRDMT